MGRHRNPILPGCHPDPSICRVGDEFFLVTSTFEYLPGLPVHRSTDLVSWELVGHAVDDRFDLSAVPDSGGLFAPTIRHHDGRFFIVCTVVHGDDGARHFVVTATDPAGPWSDPVWFDGVPGIDPSLTFDGDRVWLCGTRLASPGLWPGQTDVWLRELDPASLVPIGDERLIWRGALDGAVWAEGPHILARPGGGWMLVAAEGGTARDHAVCVAYADRIEGPYLGDPGNPRLSHRDLGGFADIVNVGHADLVDAPDGSWWAVLLATHVQDGLDSLLGRQTHLVPVVWEDRRPLFAPGVGRVRHEVEVPGVSDTVETAREVRDDFSSARLDPQWCGVRRMPQRFARTGGGRLHVTAEAASPAFVGRRLLAMHAEVGVDAEVGTAAAAGILLRTSGSAQLEVSLEAGGEACATLTAAGRPAEVGRVALGAESARLRLELDGFSVTAWADGERLAEIDVSALSTTRAGGFLGSWIGPSVHGEGTARFADFVMRETASGRVDGAPVMV